MIAPVKSLRKSDLEWLATHRCKKHSHTYLSHYECYLKEKPDDSPFQESIGYLDIEASGLNATFAYMFSYCILGSDDNIYGRVLKPKEIKKGLFDQSLTHELCDDIRRFNRIVVYYGGDHRFDLPFVRTRAVKHGANFPLYRDVFCTDLYPIVRNKFKFHSNRLEVVCKFFGIPAKTHPMDPEGWCLAQSGDQEWLNYIWDHNVEDCYSLKQAYELLSPYAMNNAKRSI